MAQCIWDEAWRGPCGQPADKLFCSKHQKVCASCGDIAVKDCEHTMGLVCGAPLCKVCFHGRSMYLEHRHPDLEY